MKKNNPDESLLSNMKPYEHSKRTNGRRNDDQTGRHLLERPQDHNSIKRPSSTETNPNRQYQSNEQQQAPRQEQSLKASHPTCNHGEIQSGCFMCSLTSHFVAVCPCCNNEVELTNLKMKSINLHPLSQLLENSQLSNNNNSQKYEPIPAPSMNSMISGMSSAIQEGSSAIQQPQSQPSSLIKDQPIDHPQHQFNQWPPVDEVSRTGQMMQIEPSVNNGVPGSEFSSLYTKGLQQFNPGMNAINANNNPSAFNPSVASMFSQQQKPAQGMSEGTCVLMVYNINGHKVNCDMLYNIYSLYCNVNKIKFLKSFEQVAQSTAMIELSPASAAQTVIEKIDQLTVFGQAWHINISKQPTIEFKGRPYSLPDGTESQKDYTFSRESKKFTKNRDNMRVNEPLNTLHISFIPSNMNADEIWLIFDKLKASSPQKVKIIGKPDKRSALVEFETISDAAEAIMLCNLTEPESIGIHNSQMKLLRIDFASARIHA